jgi:hypothetical protein
MIFTKTVLGANYEEYEAIQMTISWLTDLKNDIEEYNITQPKELIDAIYNAEMALSYLNYKNGIKCYD